MIGRWAKKKKEILLKNFDRIIERKVEERESKWKEKTFKKQTLIRKQIRNKNLGFLCT